MRVDEANLSPKAKKLIELAGVGKNSSSPPDVAKILQDNPELIGGLNEYLAWHADHWTQISQVSEQNPVPHPLTGISRVLGKK